MNVYHKPNAQQLFINELECPDLPSLEGRYSRELVSNHSKKIFELIKGIGSPLHCVFPQQFLENISRFRAVADKHSLCTKIFFAKKANKAQSFSKVCREANIGIDVASKQELELALAAGVRGDYLSVSGPEKDVALLQLAVFHGAQIAINSLEELQTILGLVEHHDNSIIDSEPGQTFKPEIVLRVQPEFEKNSRFGFRNEELNHALRILQEHRHRLVLLGFSFHLSGYDIGKRARVAADLVHWIIAAREQGFSNCNQINIGGGLPVKYTHTQQWMQFHRSIKPEHFHRSQSFTNGFYPYGNELQSWDALDLLLSTPIQNQQSLAQKFRENHIQLAMEPGRSLLDQAGLSIFSIQGMKLNDSEKPYWIATVAGMSFSLSEQWFGSEFLPSPSLLKMNANDIRQHQEKETIFPTAVAGSSCLECDMVSWRKIPFVNKPAINDCLIYHNTAGYQMDSNESAFHSVPIIPKVAIWFNEQDIHWQLESNI